MKRKRIGPSGLWGDNKTPRAGRWTAQMRTQPMPQEIGRGTLPWNIPGDN